MTGMTRKLSIHPPSTLANPHEHPEVYLVSDTMNIFEELPDEDTIGGRIGRAREAAGLSVKQVAWRLGVKVATIKAWESDRSQPGSHRLTNLAGLLHVSLSWIVHGVGIGPAEDLDDETNQEMSQQLDRLRLLHLETGQLIEKLKGEVERISAAR